MWMLHTYRVAVFWEYYQHSKEMASWILIYVPIMHCFTLLLNRTRCVPSGKQGYCEYQDYLKRLNHAANRPTDRISCQYCLHSLTISFHYQSFFMLSRSEDSNSLQATNNPKLFSLCMLSSINTKNLLKYRYNHYFKPLYYW